MVYTFSDEVEDRDGPFAERQVSDLRAEFVALATQPGANRRALCQRFEISAPRGYPWLWRYAAEGAAGLSDRFHRLAGLRHPLRPRERPVHVSGGRAR